MAVDDVDDDDGAMGGEFVYYWPPKKLKMTANETEPRPQPYADIYSPPIDGFGGELERLSTKLWHQYNEKC